MRRSVGTAGFVLALVLSAFARSASAAEAELTPLTKTINRSSGATAMGRALALQVGATTLTIGENEGSVAVSRSELVKRAPVVDEGLLLRCSGTGGLKPIRIRGEDFCLNADAVAAKGIAVNPDVLSGGLDLFVLEKAGVVRIKPAGVQAEPPVVDKLDATAQGILVPGLSSPGKAVCSKTAGTDAKTGLVVPDSLAGFLRGITGFSRCSTAVSPEGFPAVSQSSGVAEVALTLNQTIFNAQVAGQSLNAALDALQNQLNPLPAALKDPVNAAIDNLQANLTNQPVVRLSLGPNESTLRTAADAVVASAQTAAVVLKVLEGIATLEVASAKASAAVKDAASGDAAGASSTADPALLRLRVLNITLPDPGAGPPLVDLVIDPRDLQRTLAGLPDVAGVVETGDDEIVLFRGTLLESHISLATGKATSSCTVEGKALPAVEDRSKVEQSCAIPQSELSRVTAVAQSQSAASAVRVVLFGRQEGNEIKAVGPLPPVALRLAEVQAAAVRSFESIPVGPRLPLARTGPLPLTSTAAGLGAVGLAAVLRRRFAR